MRRIFIAMLDVTTWVGLFAGVVAGAYLGGKYYPETVRQATEFDWGHGLAGGVIGLVLAVTVFGVVAVLIQIEENTRRNTELFGALVRRAESQIGRGDS